MFIHANTEENFIGISYTGPVTHETLPTFGICHLLEHMICNSYKEYEEFFNEKCLYNNAYTSDTEVFFFLSGLASELDTVKHKFVKCVTTYIPKLEDFEKELPIVKQEVNDMFSDNDNALYMNICLQKFGIVSCAGIKEALDNLTFDIVKEYYNKYFHYYTVNEISSNQSFSNSRVAPTDYDLSIIEKQQYFTPIKIEAIDDNCIDVSYVSNAITPDKLYIAQFIADMLDDGLTSPLVKLIREKLGIAYWVQMYPTYFNNRVFFSITSSVSKANVDIYFSNLKEFTSNLLSYITEDRFNKIKSKKEISLKLKNINNVKLSYNFEYNRRSEVNDLMHLDTITYDDIIEFANTHVTTLDWKEYSVYDFNK